MLDLSTLQGTYYIFIEKIGITERHLNIKRVYKIRAIHHSYLRFKSLSFISPLLSKILHLRLIHEFRLYKLIKHKQSVFDSF